MRTLFTGGFVVAPEAPELLAGGEVLVDGNTIVGVGVPGAFTGSPVDQTLDVTGCLVTPGLVNTHQHDWYLLGKGLGDNALLEQWHSDCMYPMQLELTPEDFRAASELACLDMIRGGTTACVNHLVAETSAEDEEATLTPVLESGMRQFYAKAVRPHDVEDDFTSARACYERWNGAGDGRIKVGLVLEATSHWVAVGQTTEEMLVRGHALANELDTFITAHIAGGTLSKERGYLKYVLETGRTDFEFLHRLGVLDERWILAHSIHTRGHDLDLIRSAGSTVSHTPSSEAARGGGIAEIKRMVEMGIHVALGTDGPMVDHTNDMVEQIKWTRLMQNQVHNTAASIPLDTLIAMAASEGMRAVGEGGTVGTLAPGMRADIAVFDLNTLHAAVLHSPLSTFVHAGRSSDARHVMVEGQLLLHDRKFTRVDDDRVADIIGRARKQAVDLGHRAGLLP